MKILQIKKYEEAEVILKLGEDFCKYDLKNFIDTRILTMKAESLTRIAKKNGFDKWTWQGNYNERTKEIKVLLRKEIG